MMPRFYTPPTFVGQHPRAAIKAAQQPQTDDQRFALLFEEMEQRAAENRAAKVMKRCGIVLVVIGLSLFAYKAVLNGQATRAQAYQIEEIVR